MSNIFPWLILWFVTVLLFALLVPNFFFNVGPKTTACKNVNFVRAPDSSDTSCPTVTWGEYAIHVGIFALLEGLLLVVIYFVINKNFTTTLNAYTAAVTNARIAAQSALQGASVAASNAFSPTNKQPMCIPASGIEMSTFS